MKPTTTAQGSSRGETPHRISGELGIGWRRWLPGVFSVALSLIGSGISVADQGFERDIDGGLLDAFYHGKGEAPDVVAAVAALTGDQPDKAAIASRFLIALAQRTLDDETSGKAPWHATPFWGSEGENPARELRDRLARLVADIAPDQAAAASSAVLPVLEWFIRKERLVSSRVACMDALAKVRAKEADALVASLAADPGLPHGLAAVAIRQAAERKLDLPEPVLEAGVCDHHSDRRTAALDYWQARKPGEQPPAFDPLAALKTPPLRRLLDDLAKMAIDLPPADARWGKVERKSMNSHRGKLVEQVGTEWGWVLERENQRLRLLNFYGRIHEFTLGTTQEMNGPATISFTAATMEDTVKMIEKLRAEGDSEHRLSERGGFSGQFQGAAAGIPEMLLAVALDRSGKPDLCARVLMPALDSYPEDQWFFQVTRDRMDNLAGQRMLVEFIGQRDYGRALEMARRLDRDFAGTRYHSMAKRLLKELPERREDFHSLTLPTRREWKQWCETHTREERIAYLCARLRLMNCYQDSQPGDVDFLDLQYAEPCGLDEDAAYGCWLGKTQVINPLVELIGNKGWHGLEDEDEPAEKIPGMNLGIRDVPLIAPFLKDDHLLLAVGFWRNFHPSRTLTGTREILEWVLSKAAKRQLLEPDEWEKFEAAEVSRRIGEIITWAHEHVDEGPADLLLDKLTEFAEAKEDWLRVEDTALELVELKERRAFPLIAGWLDQERADPAEILGMLGKLDPKQAASRAESFLDDDKDLDVRLAAALVLLAAGERAKALPVIGEVFATVAKVEMDGNHLQEALEALARDNNNASWETITRLFEGGEVQTWGGFDGVTWCRKLEARGNPAGLSYFRRMLDDANRAKANMNLPAIGDRFIEGYAPHDAAIRALGKRTKPESEERLAALRKWLDERIPQVSPPQAGRRP
jgi:hypothetical protein